MDGDGPQCVWKRPTGSVCRAQQGGRAANWVEGRRGEKQMARSLGQQALEVKSVPPSPFSGAEDRKTSSD